MVVIMGVSLALVLPLRSEANRPDQMRQLAELLRGTWNGTLVPDQADVSLDMWGRWILSGHFLELEIVTKNKSKIVKAGKFIFGWKDSENAYSCYYYDSSGEFHSSLWSRKDGFIMVRQDDPNQFLKQGEGEGRLVFHFNGIQMIFQLSSR